MVLFVGAIIAYRIFTKEPEVSLDNVATCLPAPVENYRAASSAIRRNPGDVDLYFDVSGGMAGYVANSPNAIGNLASLTRNFTRSSLYSAGGGEVDYYKFGEYRFNRAEPEAPEQFEDPAAFARPAIYTDSETRIADLLEWVLHSRESEGSGALSVIVTDLMLDDREAIDAFEASVGGSLRTMIVEEGLSVGILAVRVPFNGRIFVGTEAVSASISDRPLVILLIGTPYQVRTYFEYLDTAEITPFSADTAVSDRSFALFGLEAGSIVLGEPALSGVSTGFIARPIQTRIPGAEGIQSYVFDAERADAADEGGLLLSVEADAGVADFEVIGNQPLWEGWVWRLDPTMLDAEGCESGAAWTSVGALPPGGGSVSGQTVNYTLTQDVLNQLGADREGTYLVQVVAGQRGIVNDHPAAAWMTEWSMDNSQLLQRLRASSGAQRTGVPGLEPLRRILLAELMIPGREEIERSATQVIIQSE